MLSAAVLDLAILLILLNRRNDLASAKTRLPHCHSAINQLIIGEVYSYDSPLVLEPIQKLFYQFLSMMVTNMSPNTSI